MHGVGMQEKRARGVVSSARWSHGRPMDWDGLEDSQAFWATSGRNTYLCVASHSFSLQFFSATMHFGLYYFVKEIMFKCIIKLQSIRNWCSSGGWDTSHWPRRVTTGHSTLSLPSPQCVVEDLFDYNKRIMIIVTTICWWRWWWSWGPKSVIQVYKSESCAFVHMFESILDNIELCSSLLHNNFQVILFLSLFFMVCYATDGCIHFLVIDGSSSTP